MDFCFDPMHGERHQSHATLGIKSLNGLHQANVTLLNQVRVWQAVSEILSRYRNDQTQMRQHQFTSRSNVLLVAQATRKQSLLLSREHRQSVDGRNIGINRSQCAGVRYRHCEL